MFKKVKQFATQNGLTADEKTGLIYGYLNGLFVAIKQDPNTPACHTVSLWVKPEQPELASAVSDYLTQCTAKYQYLQKASYQNFKITANFQGLGFKWGKLYTPCLEEFLKDIIAYCHNNRLVQCCELCGTEDDLNLYKIEDEAHLLCSSCYAQVTSKIQDDVLEKKKGGNGNVVGGIVGALLGALIGVALWVLIYQLGYISAIGGAVMVVCALKGYEMLGGKLNTLGIIIGCVISVVMLYFAEQLSLGLEIYNAFKDSYDITFFDAYRSIPDFMEEPEISSAFFSDMAFGYVLMAVGAWGTVRQALKNSSGKKKTSLITTVTGSASKPEV